MVYEQALGEEWGAGWWGRGGWEGKVLKGRGGGGQGGGGWGGGVTTDERLLGACRTTFYDQSHSQAVSQADLMARFVNLAVLRDCVFFFFFGFVSSLLPIALSYS